MRAFIFSLMIFFLLDFSSAAKIRSPQQDSTFSPKVLRLGDACESSEECDRDFPGSVCDPPSRTCNCSSDTPVRGHLICGKIADWNETCSFSAQCRTRDKQRECRHQRCQCRFRWKPVLADGHIWCVEQEVEEWGVGSYVDPTMFGVLAGLILMFVIMCVVLRLFSKARWSENRTIFNTPNPRLMNASLLKDSGAARNSAKANRRDSLSRHSRHPSLVSIARSPNGSSGTGRRPASPQLQQATSDSVVQIDEQSTDV